MKLWHDDVRPPPEGWTWVKTNDEAKHWLRFGSLVTEISLDHDLGIHVDDVPDEDDPEYWDKVIQIAEEANPDEQETGYDLVCWMVENEHVPDRITIHSWNPVGATKMAQHFNEHGYDCRVSPFKVTR